MALKYRTPVILLSDGYLANGAEPWRLPDVDSLPDISVPFATELNHATPRAPRVLALRPRPRDAGPRRGPSRARPGSMHRIGGLEKEDGSGNISYEPGEPRAMVRLRADKVAGIANDIPACGGHGDATTPRLLVLGWGSTWGAIDAAVRAASAAGPRRWPGSTWCTSTRSRATWATSCAATHGSSCPR